MSPYGGWLLVIGCWWLVSGDLETDTPRVRLGVSLAALQTPSAAPSHQQPATSNQPPATQPQYNGTSVRLLTLLLLTPLLPAQDRSQFTWQGEVDGTAILYLHANQLTVQIKDGAPVARQQYRFYALLPDSHQDARLEVREGRGYVHIIDQPRLENHYTLGVSVEDQQPGSSFYSIALYWDSSNQAFEHGGRTDRVVWTGRVDEEAIISCQDKTCSARADHGAPVANEHFKFSRPLPRRQVEVSLEDIESRGEIRLLEQPSESNNYTARVSIRDPRPGFGEYSFTLAWPRPSNKEIASSKDAPPPVVEAQRGLIWSGIVNGRGRVTIEGSSSISESFQGSAPISGERVDFLRPLPNRSDVKPLVKKLSGNGRVDIVEYPTEKNNHRLIFEISNSEPGPSTYAIEVDW